MASILDLSAGIPSHDRFNAIFQVLDPAAFEKCLLSWIAAVQEITQDQVVAIDGKTLRGSFDRASGKSAIHMVSAWAKANRLSLGQVVVEEKSNEITAIPELLKLLELKGCLVTIDAMGCQTAIAEAIVDREADYVLAVKDNQPTLHRGIAQFFVDQMEDDFAKVTVGRHETKEKSRGRIEHRSYYVCEVPDDLPDKERWKGLKSIGMAINITTRDGKTSDGVRYYISRISHHFVVIECPPGRRYWWNNYLRLPERAPDGFTVYVEIRSEFHVASAASLGSAHSAAARP